MGVYTYTFTHRGMTVTYRITARTQHRADQIAREREQSWRLAVDAYLEGQEPWS